MKRILHSHCIKLIITGPILAIRRSSQKFPCCQLLQWREHPPLVSSSKRDFIHQKPVRIKPLNHWNHEKKIRAARNKNLTHLYFFPQSLTTCCLISFIVCQLVWTPYIGHYNDIYTLLSRQRAWLIKRVTHFYRLYLITGNKICDFYSSISWERDAPFYNTFKQKKQLVWGMLLLTEGTATTLHLTEELFPLFHRTLLKKSANLQVEFSFQWDADYSVLAEDSLVIMP